MSRTSSAVLGVLGAAALFGTSGTARALLAPDSWPPAVAAVRLLIGAAGLLTVMWLVRGDRSVPLLWRRPTIWVLGVAVAGYQALFFVGVQQTGVAVGTLVSLGLAPLLAGGLGWALGEGAPGWRWGALTAVAVAGLVLLTATGGASVRPLGVVAALGAGSCYAVYTVLGARLAASGESPGAVLAAGFAVGAILLIPLLPGAASWVLTPAGVGLALWLGLIATTLAYLLFGLGLATLQPGHIATLNLAEPVVATVLGVTLLHESLSAAGWLGCALVAAALLGLALAERRQATGSGQSEARVVG